MAEERIELFIETLTGTAFELKVSPLETIMSIKAKIQRLEGIPITQQHLIWQSNELDNQQSLQDYQIKDGCTLKLVLGMRGGPINTRRVPLEERQHLQHVAEYLKTRREELNEGLPSGKPMTVVMFQDGEKVHMYTVVDVNDGLSSRVSGSASSNSSSQNLTDDEAELARIQENLNTRKKMSLLKEKMKTHGIKKRTRKKSRSGSVSLPATKLGRKKSPLTIVGGTHSSHPLRLPPIKTTSRNSSENHSAEKRTIALNSHSQTGISVSSPIMQKESEFNAATPLTVESNSTYLSTRFQQDTMQNNENFLSLWTRGNGSSSHRKDGDELVDLAASLLSIHLSQSRQKPWRQNLSRSRDTPESRSSKYTSYESLPQYRKSSGLGVSQYSNISADNELSSSNLPQKDKTKDKETIPSHKTSTNRSKNSTRLMSEGGTLPTTSRRLLDLDQWLQSRPRTTPVKGDVYRPFDGLLKNGRFWASRNSFNNDLQKTDSSQSNSHLSLSSSFNSTVLSPLSHSLSDYRDRRWSQNQLVPLFISSHENLNSSPKMPDQAMLNSPQDKSRKNEKPISPVAKNEGVSCRKTSSKSSNKTNSGRAKTKGNSEQKLPTLKTKKKTGKKCAWCNKKTGIATSYTCRCGKNFCATHRYAELHHCTFDYKTEGRRLIQQSNPPVRAPKLPKI
ncbi:AN1-type zinc finger protein 4-like [Tachypleus tridentatus]|uniref:AN1-type zinc finger protein 4-like n=1 Tax=Tachypleus tridentatus TaxID=6853 RepID=UPI003FD44E7D